MVQVSGVSGFRELEKVLRQLPQNVENRVLQKATSAGAREMRKQVRLNAPKGQGKQSPSSKKYKRLARNIKAEVLRVAKRKGQRGARVSTGNAFWALFLEFGTRYIGAKPWFRPAIEQSQSKAVEALKKELGAGIEREATKLARQHGVR